MLDFRGWAVERVSLSLSHAVDTRMPLGTLAGWDLDPSQRWSAVLVGPQWQRVLVEFVEGESGEATAREWDADAHQYANLLDFDPEPVTVLLVAIGDEWAEGMGQTPYTGSPHPGVDLYTVAHVGLGEVGSGVVVATV